MLTRLRLLTPSAVVNAAEALHDAEHARAHACFMDTLSDVVNARQTTGFDPFAVNTEMGTIHADRIAMHPRHWLTKELGQVEDQALATVRTHLGFLFS